MKIDFLMNSCFFCRAKYWKSSTFFYFFKNFIYLLAVQGCGQKLDFEEKDSIWFRSPDLSLFMMSCIPKYRLSMRYNGRYSIYVVKGKILKHAVMIT
jgi:hypothetical protein